MITLYGAPAAFLVYGGTLILFIFTLHWKLSGVKNLGCIKASVALGAMVKTLPLINMAYLQHAECLWVLYYCSGICKNMINNMQIE